MPKDPQLSVCILFLLCSISFMTHGLNKKLCIAVAYWVTPLFQDGCTHFDVSSRPPASCNVSLKKYYRQRKGSWFEIWGTGRRSPQVSEPCWSWVFLGSGLEPASNTRWSYHCSPPHPAPSLLMHCSVLLKFTWLPRCLCCQMFGRFHISFSSFSI
jgi:hypothetical protein